MLPHAVRKDFFLGVDPSREFEIAWIGQTSGEFYKTRAQWLPKLAQEFHTNDWSRWYSVAEVANVYRRSQIVVNIGRDDFPQDANLRVFEVLASGTLLLTSMPTELAQLGFQIRHSLRGLLRSRAGLLSWRNIPMISAWTSF